MPLKPQIHALVWVYRHIAGKLKIPEMSTIETFLNPESICFDVGAHGGAWARALAKSAYKGHVYAFEALPYYAEALAATIKLIGPKNISIIKYAVSDSDGDLRLKRKDDLGNTLTGKTHVVPPSERYNEGNVVVPTLSLDGFWKQLGEKKIDFIKLDVEGFELFVLRGARKLVKNCRPVFFNEVNAEWCKRYNYNPSEIFHFFQERDYAPFYIRASSELLAVHVVNHVNRDVLFLPKERVPN